MSDATLVAGIDSSTQSTKVVLCRADDGLVVAELSVPHPEGTECHPRHWLAAIHPVRELLQRAAAVSVAAQQHGMVVLDAAGEVIRPALLWNDTRSAPQAEKLTQELGGPATWAARAGSVPVASFTVTKLRWLAEHEPESASKVAAVMLPHDWLTWQLGGRGERTTDRGDASGTGYWSPAAGAYLPEMLAAAIGREVALPRVAGPNEIVGRTEWGAVLGPGTGDNMGAALGLGLEPGDVAVSIGTSGTAFAVSDVPAADPSGLVAGFADATGRFLPLVCTLNAARILSSAARLLRCSLEELSTLALAAQPGAGGLTLLPYLDGERTPNRPGADGVLRGLTTANATPENLARAAVEALLASLADAVDHLAHQGVQPRRVLLIGGGARAEAVRRIAPQIFGVEVTVPEPEEYVALGAARQAAWALAKTPHPPAWTKTPARTYDAAPEPHVRRRYAALRDGTASWGAPEAGEERDKRETNENRGGER
ncbi:xylulokinase [Pendulispora albinea]|uniref:Xylulose kinase n=1 Tax=Pendulispora albinea TaxID=2741071 RepID=A0ABZ2LQ81_9BACT